MFGWFTKNKKRRTKREVTQTPNVKSDSSSDLNQILVATSLMSTVTPEEEYKSSRLDISDTEVQSKNDHMHSSTPSETHTTTSSGSETSWDSGGGSSDFGGSSD